MIYLIILYVILQIADVATTAHILKKGGVESNPFMAKVIDKFGFIGLSIIKILVTLFIMFAYINDGLPMWLLITMDAVMVGVVWHNLKVIKDKK